MNFIISGSIGGARLFSRQYRDVCGEVKFFSLNNSHLELVKQISYKDPSSLVANGRVRFTGACFANGSLYVTTFSQVMKLDLKNYHVTQVTTSDRFNDLHGISFNGFEFAVVNTGLDLIHFFDQNFKQTSIIDIGLISGSAKKFPPHIDYRLKQSTKPHFTHPNHCFWFENKWWVTRFIQQDAFCLKTGEKWDFSQYGRPHDGVVTKNGIFFTTINGYLIKIDKNRQTTAWNLPQLAGRDHLGWGRGVMIRGDKAYVAFTKIRNSISSMAKLAMTSQIHTPKLDSRIIEIDMIQEQVLNEFTFPDNYFRHSTLFSLIPY